MGRASVVVGVDRSEQGTNQGRRGVRRGRKFVRASCMSRDMMDALGFGGGRGEEARCEDGVCFHYGFRRHAEFDDRGALGVRLDGLMAGGCGGLVVCRLK